MNHPQRPAWLTVQWHITDRCNLRCRHCYQEHYQDAGPDRAALRQIAEQIFSLHGHLSGSQKLPLLLTLTGGEPCTHPDFDVLLDDLAKHPVRPKLAVLSNGSLIDAGRANTFARLGVAFVQLSVEGTQDVHDAIRGAGHFDVVIGATRLLVDSGVRVLWSFTAHKNNAAEFAAVARLAEHHRVDRIWSDRLIPVCRDDAPLTLDAQESAAYFRAQYRVKREIEAKPGNRTEVAMLRALQFQAAGGQPYRCTAGGELITLMPNGDLYPCRRMPIRIGNLFETPLVHIYTQSPLLQRLRQAVSPDACSGCIYRTTCRGGLRCLAYAVKGDPFGADPGCIHAAEL